MARRKPKDIDSMSGRKKYFDNQMFTEEPTTASRVNTGIKARLLGTCCLASAISSTTSPMGSKPRIEGGWEDCPAFDLEPAASSAAENNIAKCRSSNPNGLQPRQVPLGEAEQALLNSRPGSTARFMAAVNSLSSPEVRTTSAEVMTPVMAMDADDSRLDNAADSSTCGHRKANLHPQASTQDSAVDMYQSDNDSLPAAESPLPQSSLPDRQTLQHRVALRLLERRGVLPEGGRISNSGSPMSPSFSNSCEDSPSGFTHLQQMPSSPQAISNSSPPNGSAPGSGMLPVSPNSAPRTEYYSALSSPVAAPNSGEGTTVQTAAEADERLCLQEEEYDLLGVRCDGYRMSAPGYAIPQSALQGRTAWTGSNFAEIDSNAPGSTIAGCPTTPDGASAADDLLLQAHGSDYGGTMPLPVCVPARGLRAAVGTANGDLHASHGVRMSGSPATPRSAIIVGRPDPSDDDMVMGTAQRRYPPPPAWSAAGSRDELSQQEKEWLFTQPGGIGGLTPVMSLGEGGEGLVDLVRLELPGRTVHLARKATRTCLPAFALSATSSGTAATMLGLRSQQNVSYRFPFEFFDREVKAMKAVKDSGFVVRFQAATYDHEAGQGFILMEAAPYGTLEDLHAALCRSQLQPVQRQRPALLQRAMARLNFGNAKSSAPPSLMGASAASVAPAPPAGSPRSAAPTPHSPTVTGSGDRTSLPRIPGARAIGLRGGGALDAGAGPGDLDRASCCSNVVMVSPLPEPAAAAAVTDGFGIDGDSDAAMQFAALGSCLMSTRALRYYGACMLQALVVLHEAGYVYRDLKMSNVMICEGGRVRLTDFGAASPCLPDQPGLFGGAAGTRAYLAPEVLPWLGNGGKGGKHSSGNGSGAGPEAYTTTVDSWTWGLMMVELATGWSLKALTQRVIRRVCNPRGPELPDLPPNCGLPPALRQLLLDHVLLRDPRERWPAARIRTHPFFEGVEWETLAEVDGPHAHLFGRGRLGNTPPPLVLESSAAEALAMAEGETVADRRGSRPRGMVSPAAVAGMRSTLASGGGDASVDEGTEGNAVVPFGHRLGSSRPSYNGGPPSPRSPALLSPSGVMVSPVGGGGAAASAFTGGRTCGLLSPAASPAGASFGRISGTGYNSSLSGAAAGLRISSSGNAPPIGPVVMTPGTPTSPSFGVGSGLLAAAGIAIPGGLAVSGSGRRHTPQATAGSSRLSSGTYSRQSPAVSPLTPSLFTQQVAAAE